MQGMEHLCLWVWLTGLPFLSRAGDKSLSPDGGGWHRQPGNAEKKEGGRECERKEGRERHSEVSKEAIVRLGVRGVQGGSRWGCYQTGQTTDRNTALLPIWAPQERNRSTPGYAPGRFCSQDICADSPKDPTASHPIPTPFQKRKLRPRGGCSCPRSHCGPWGSKPRSVNSQ